MNICVVSVKNVAGEFVPVLAAETLELATARLAKFETVCETPAFFAHFEHARFDFVPLTEDAERVRMAEQVLAELGV